MDRQSGLGLDRTSACGVLPSRVSLDVGQTDQTDRRQSVMLARDHMGYTRMICEQCVILDYHKLGYSGI